MSGWFDSFNQAVGFTDDPAKAQENAVNAQIVANSNANSLQRDIYNYQKGMTQPFYAGSLPAYYQLLSAITGKGQMYADPNYVLLQNTDPGYVPGKTLYRGPNGEIVSSAPMISTGIWNPTETPAFKWQQSQQDKNLGRTLRTLGRQNSTYGMDAIAKANQNLYAMEYDKQLGRLADLTNIARGGASSLANYAGGYGSGVGNNMLNFGNSIANASLAGGMLKQNSLYGGLNTMGSLGSLGMKLYDYFKNSGSGYGSNYGSLYNDAGGDINNVDFGNDWGPQE